MPAWMCGSIPPGMTICPVASTTRAAPIAARLPGAPIAAILPPETPISAGSVAAGMTAVPPDTIRSNMVLPLDIRTLRPASALLVDRVDPADLFRFLRRLDVEVDDDRLVVAAHQHAFER